MKLSVRFFSSFKCNLSGTVLFFFILCTFSVIFILPIFLKLLGTWENFGPRDGRSVLVMSIFVFSDNALYVSVFL